MSVGPPAGNAMSSLIDRDGKAAGCACVKAPSAGSESAAADCSKRRRGMSRDGTRGVRRDMKSLLKFRIGQQEGGGLILSLAAVARIRTRPETCRGGVLHGR